MTARKKGMLKEMQSLLGLLNFAACVIPMGRVVSKRLYFSTSFVMAGCNTRVLMYF